MRQLKWLIIGSCCGLVSCGYKGPLYLPQQTKSQPATTNQYAPPPPAAAKPAATAPTIGVESTIMPAHPSASATLNR